MSEWRVLAGDVVIPVKANFNEQARRRAVSLFRNKHGIKLPIDIMLPDFKAYKVPEPKDGALNEKLLVLFYKEMEPTYKKDTRGRKVAVSA